jgi:serine protease Do
MRQSLKLKDRQGTLVGDVFAGDAADKAGIKTGDVILEIAGKTIKDDRELAKIVATLHVGSKVNVKVFRNGKEMTLPIIIAERKNPQEQASGSHTTEQFGMTAQEVTPEIAKYFALPEKTGVIITDIKAGGPADEAGLKPRDIILKVNNIEIAGLREYEAAMTADDKSDALLMLIRRGKANFFVILKKGKEEKK